MTFVPNSQKKVIVTICFLKKRKEEEEKEELKGKIQIQQRNQLNFKIMPNKCKDLFIFEKFPVFCCQDLSFSRKKNHYITNSLLKIQNLRNLLWSQFQSKFYHLD